MAIFSRQRMSPSPAPRVERVTNTLSRHGDSSSSPRHLLTRAVWDKDTIASKRAIHHHTWYVRCSYVAKAQYKASGRISQPIYCRLLRIRELSYVNVRDIN